MAGKHPIQIPPVRPLYRIAATGLGASMWLFVSANGPVRTSWLLTLVAVNVSCEERW